MTKTKELSVIIPTALKNPKFLQGALESLERTTVSDFEVIVVLNGSGMEKAKKIAEVYGARVLEFEENQGYGGGMNAGFAIASGEYLVGSNDDVLFTPEWDLNLREVLDTFHKKNPYPKCGIVGPCTNFAGGVQHAPIPGLRVENLDEVAEKFRQENLDNIVCTSFVSGFLFMVPREFYEAMVEEDGYFFDHETFPIGGAEDNDLCARAIHRGWSPVVAGNCYIYHYGSRTLKQYPELAGGVNNLLHLYKKWKPTEPQILGALYRVKMWDAYSKEDWLRSLAQTYKFVDKIYILNDQSAKEFWPTVEEFAPFQDKIQEILNISHKQMESDDRQKLYEIARDDGCDWVISVDHDEIFEDKFDYAYAQRLMAVPQPICCGYIFHWYHLWNEEGYWRSDGNRGLFSGVRMCRALPNFYIPQRAFHVGNIPHMPKHVWSNTSIRIKHLGQMRKEERERKYLYYEKYDTVKDAALIGNADYSHIKDETHAVIEPWIEDNSISLVTIMRDEETRLHHFLNQYAMFVDELILVDTGSEDRSVEVAEIWGAKVLSCAWKDDFSIPRNVGLKACTKTWILHLDIDEDAPELGKIRRMTEIQSADGYLFYINNYLPDGKSALSETVRLMRNNGKWYYTGYVHETVDEAVKLHKLKLRRAITGINHAGFLQEKSKMKKKLANYLRMNLRQLKDNPNDARAYYNTAMHFMEGGFEDVGEYLLTQAMALNSRFIQPINELAMFYATKAQQCYKHLVTILPEEHVLVDGYRKSVEVLEQVREDKNPIDVSHIYEVLQEEEFVEIGKKLSKLAERG